MFFVAPCTYDSYLVTDNTLVCVIVTRLSNNSSLLEIITVLTMFAYLLQ